MDHGILKTGVPRGTVPVQTGSGGTACPRECRAAPPHPAAGAGVARFCVLLHRTAGVGFVAILPAALHDIRPGARLRRQQRLHCVRQQAVIAIHKQDPAAYRPGQTGVAGAGRAAALLRVQHGDPSLPGVLGQNGPAAVGGAVLHRQHLQAASGVLVQDAVQTGAQKALPRCAPARSPTHPPHRPAAAAGRAPRHRTPAFGQMPGARAAKVSSCWSEKR